MTRAIVLVVVSACGRLGFDTADDVRAGDGGPGDALLDGASDGPDATLPGDAGVARTFGERPACDVMDVTRDTYISQAASAVNFGAEDNLRIERDNDDRALIAFTVNSLPAGTIVLSAELQLVVEVATAGATIEVRPVLEAWTESGADYFLRALMMAWTQPGAGPPQSAGTVVATFSGSAAGPVTVAVPASLVQRWVDMQTYNGGFVLSSDSDQTVRLVSSEGASTQRPVLAVTIQ